MWPKKVGQRMDAMFSHVTVGTNDMDGARRFYDAVLSTLGHRRFAEGQPHYADVQIMPR